MGQSNSRVDKLKKYTRFIGVGVFNTLTNIILFDVLIFIFGIGSLVANLVSLVVSIVISYFLNKAFVFKDERDVNSKQLLMFLVGTFIIQLIFQHLAVWLLGEKYTSLGLFMYRIFDASAIHLGKNFVVVNVAKFIGVGFSIVVSYIFYEKIVFASNSETKDS